MKTNKICLFLLPLLMLTACKGNETSSNNSSSAPDSSISSIPEGAHYISIEGNDNGVISADKTYAIAGETVTLSAMGRGSYHVTTYYVNNEPIEGHSFSMPDCNVTIKGDFVEEFTGEALNFSAYGGGVIATSYWYFEYGETGLNIKVKVNDRIIVNDLEASKGYDDDGDHIAFILSYDSLIGGFDEDSSHRIVVRPDGTSHVNRAISTTDWGEDMKTTEKRFKATSTLKSSLNGDGYDGYEVNVFFNYNFFGLERDDVLDLISVAPQMRNTNNYNATSEVNYTGCDCNYKKANTHPYILEDGSIVSRGIR